MSALASRNPTATGSAMMAIVRDRYGGADVLELRSVAEPRPGDDEVLLKVRAAGLDRGVWHVMAGMPYAMRLAGFGVRKPKNAGLGSDVAGVVTAVGAHVTDLRPGDAVFGTCGPASRAASFAEYAVAHPDRLARMPVNLTFEQAAAVPISGLTALQALRDNGRVFPGHRVLVIGASGGVGTFAVQIAKAFGAHVTGVCSTAKVDLVRSLGADQVLDYTREDITGRYDLVLDIGGNRPLRQLRRMLAQGGTLVFVGGEGGDRWTGGFDRPARAMALSPFVGQRLGTPWFIASENREDLEYLRRLIETGAVTPAISSQVGLGDVPDAVRALAAGRVGGKIVITP
jgi:NADPH:quinone reductase-like Zn-dependent oxidoreductase